MTGKYTQMLIDKKTHEDITAAKQLLGSISGRRLSSKEVINEFLGRRMRFLRLRKEIRNYINAFVSRASLNRHILGLLLFGSVARNRFGSYSDIDVLVVVDGKAVGRFDEINETIEGVEGFRRQLIDLGLHLRIRPLLLSAGELGFFRPIYVDFLEDGVVLFERDDVLFDFMNDIRRSVEYEKEVVGDEVMVRWKIKA